MKGTTMTNERDELFEQVDDRVHDIYLRGYNREGISDSRSRIEQIIDMVRADERKRIREALAESWATAEGNTWDGCPMVQSAYRQYADALIGLGAAPTVDDDAVERAAKAIDEFVRNQISAFGVADMPVSEFWSGQAEDIARAALAAAGITPGDAREGGGEQADPPIELRVVNEINKRHNEEHPVKRLPTLEDDGFVANHWPGHPRP